MLENVRDASLSNMGCPAWGIPIGGAADMFGKTLKKLRDGLPFA